MSGLIGTQAEGLSYITPAECIAYARSSDMEYALRVIEDSNLQELHQIVKAALARQKELLQASGYLAQAEEYLRLKIENDSRKSW